MKFFPVGMFKTMRIVLKNLFRPNITLMYPHERWELPENARWAVEMKYDEDGNHKCTGCLICQRTCPDYIIDIDVKTDEDKNKTIKSWKYQLGACMMCSLCVEACPFDAIQMGKDYELAFTDKENITLEYLSNVPVAKPKRAAAAKPAAKPAQKPAEKPSEAKAPAAEAQNPAEAKPENNTPQGGEE